MSKRTGVIKKIIPVELARPRSRTSENFAVMRQKVYREFLEESEITPDYCI